MMSRRGFWNLFLTVPIFENWRRAKSEMDFEASNVRSWTGRMTVRIRRTILSMGFGPDLSRRIERSGGPGRRGWQILNQFISKGVSMRFGKMKSRRALAERLGNLFKVAGWLSGRKIC